MKLLEVAGEKEEQQNPSEKCCSQCDGNADGHPRSKAQASLCSVQPGQIHQTFIMYITRQILLISSYSSKIPLKDKGDPEPISVPEPPMLAE